MKRQYGNPFGFFEPEKKPTKEESKFESLITAAEKGDISTISALLAKGLDVNGYFNHEVALTAAIKSGHFDTVVFLIEHGANININVTRYNFSPLIIAAQHGQDKIVKLLLDKGADRKPMGYGHDALHFAIQNEQIAVVKLLLARNFKASMSDLTTAIYHSDSVNFAKMILDNLRKQDNFDANELQRILGAGLLKAAEEGHIEQAKLFIDCGADVNIAQSPTNSCWTPLFHAMESSDLHMMDLLLKNGADVNKMNLTDTPLTFADHYEVVSKLLEYHADVNRPDIEGITPLMKAARYAKPETIELLISKGAEINQQNKSGKNFAYGSQLAPDGKYIPELVEFDAGTRGYTALMYAIEAGKTDVTKVLLEHGANIDLVSDTGKTARVIAEEKGHQEIIALLSPGLQNVPLAVTSLKSS